MAYDDIGSDGDPMERIELLDEKTQQSVEQAHDVEEKADANGEVTTDAFSVDDALDVVSEQND